MFTGNDITQTENTTGNAIYNTYVSTTALQNHWAAAIDQLILRNVQRGVIDYNGAFLIDDAEEDLLDDEDTHTMEEILAEVEAEK